MSQADFSKNPVISFSVLRAISGHEVVKKQYPDYKMILHSDQGSVYASKAFNELLLMYNITHSMSRAGKDTNHQTVNLDIQFPTGYIIQNGSSI